MPGDLANPTIARQGARHTYTWPNEDVSISLVCRKYGEGVRARLDVYQAGGAVLRGVEVTLASLTSRKSVNDMLQKRLPGPEWATLVELAFSDAEAVFLAPPPIINLDDVQVSDTIEYLCYPLVLAEETNVICGDAGSGKSQLSQIIAVAVQKKLTLPLQLSPKRQRNVLILDWETSPSSYRRKLKRVAEGFEIDVNTGIRYVFCDRSIPELQEAIDGYIEQFDIGLVIVDSLGQAASGDLNNSEVALRTMNAIRSLGQRRSLDRLVIAHVPAAAAEMPLALRTIVGNRYFRNGARNIWTVLKADPYETNLSMLLHHNKTNEDSFKADFALEIGFYNERVPPATTLRVGSMEIPEFDQEQPLRQRLIALVRSNGGQLLMGSAEIARTLSGDQTRTIIKEDNVRKTLDRLIAANRLRRLPAGGIGLAADPRRSITQQRAARAGRAPGAQRPLLPDEEADEASLSPF